MSNSDNKELDGVGGVGDDVSQQLHIGFAGDEQAPADPVHLETHQRHDSGDRAHVNLNQEEYTPDELARMLGTSLEVVMGAIRQGELKAERQGQDVVCIGHSEVVDWLRRRGPGI